MTASSQPEPGAGGPSSAQEYSSIAAQLDSAGEAPSWPQPGPSFVWTNGSGGEFPGVTPSSAASQHQPQVWFPSVRATQLGANQSPNREHAQSLGPEVAGARARRGLGIAAFAIVTAMTLGCVLLAYLGGRLLGAGIMTVGTGTLDPGRIARAAPTLSDELSASVGLGFLCALLGVAGWITAIAARTRRSAPSLALGAIIVGLCAPILAFMALLMATTP